MLEAIVLINAKPGQLHAVAQALVAREGVHELYSVAGAYDLVAVLRTARNERLEELVTGEIAALPGVERTTTLVAFRCLSRREADGAFSLGFETPAPDSGTKEQKGGRRPAPAATLDARADALLPRPPPFVEL